jgi:hypothetical protein
MSEDRFDVEWQGYEHRHDMKIVVSDWLKNPSAESVSITRTEGIEIGWTVQGGVGIDFSVLTKALNASLQGTYSQSRTFSITYEGKIGSGQTGRMVFIPKMHHINGWITAYGWQLVGDVLLPEDTPYLDPEVLNPDIKLHTSANKSIWQ